MLLARDCIHLTFFKNYRSCFVLGIATFIKPIIRSFRILHFWFAPQGITDFIHMAKCKLKVISPSGMTCNDF